MDIDYGRAVALAAEGRLTLGEIADACGWPKRRSLSQFVRVLEARLPVARRVRGLESPGPVARVRNGVV